MVAFMKAHYPNEVGKILDAKYPPLVGQGYLNWPFKQTTYIQHNEI